MPFWLQLAAAGTVVAVGASAIRRHATLASASSVVELILREDGFLECRTTRGDCYEARASAASTAFSWLIVLLLAQPGRRTLRAVVLVPDSLGQNEMRQLRTWLRWYAGTTP